MDQWINTNKDDAQHSEMHRQSHWQNLPYPSPPPPLIPL